MTEKKIGQSSPACKSNLYTNKVLVYWRKCIFIALKRVISLNVLVRVTQLQPFLTVRILLFVCQAKENLKLSEQHFRKETHNLPDAGATNTHSNITSFCNEKMLCYA